MIVDTFLYAGLGAEDALVELRMHELDGVVDHHVIVEGRQDFQGHPKPLRFPALAKRLGHLAANVDYQPIDLPDSNIYPRAPGGRERFARNALVKNLPPGGAQDAIIISDCDEIPRAEVLKRVATSGWVTYVQLGMVPYYLHMNLRIVSDVGQAPMDRKTWPGPVVVRRRVLEHESAYELRDVPGRRLVPYGGWHFSSMGGAAAMQEKLNSWGHPDRNIAPLNGMEHLEACYRNGTDWDIGRAGGPLQMEFAPVDEHYPRYVREHPEKFAAFMGHPAEVRA